LKWLAEFHNPYQLDIRDDAGTLGLNLGVYGAPETFFIDAKGIIRDKYVGDDRRAGLARKTGGQVPGAGR
jgi:cytochrome c biogenesis protein CcmG/thiol:disulfide interchange protein DsbE